MDMSDKENSFNVNEMNTTPKKRDSSNNLAVQDLSMTAIKEERGLKRNRKLRYYNYANAFYVNTFPTKYFFIKSTPVSKRKSVEPRKSFKSSENVTPFEIKHKIQELEDLKLKKIDILTEIQKLIDFEKSMLNIEFLKANKREDNEVSIYMNPILFESDGFSKFITKDLLLDTKLSTIYMCQHRLNNQYYIVKVGHEMQNGLKHLSDSSSEILNEIKILSLIGRHVNIVDYYDSWIQDNKAFIQMEFIGGGSLLDFIIGNQCLNIESDVNVTSKDSKFRLSNKCAMILIAHISSALVMLHDVVRLYHGDVKPSNILIDMIKYPTPDIMTAKSHCSRILQEEQINPMLRFKLCDFGRSGPTENIHQRESGDGRYMPNLSERSDSEHDDAMFRDVFSLGLTVYECLGGVVNQNVERSFMEFYDKLDAWPDGVTEELRSIIMQMANPDVRCRLRSRDVMQIDSVSSLVLSSAWDSLLEQPSQIIESTSVDMEMD